MSETKILGDVAPIEHPATLEIDDFVLELMRADDSEEAYRIHELNRDFWATHLDYAAGYTAEKAHEDFEKAKPLFTSGKLFSYWIVKDGEKLGDVGMTILEDGKAELGYKLIERAQGQGLATRAAAKLIEYGFEKLGLETVNLLIKPTNEPSRKIAERLGAEIVGQVDKETNGIMSSYDIWEINR